MDCGLPPACNRQEQQRSVNAQAPIHEGGKIMPKAYWIAHVTVTEPEQYKFYAGAAPESFKKYGATILARPAHIVAP